MIAAATIVAHCRGQTTTILISRATPVQRGGVGIGRWFDLWQTVDPGAEA